MIFDELLASGVEFVVETSSVDETMAIWDYCYRNDISEAIPRGVHGDLRFAHGDYQGWNEPGIYRSKFRKYRIDRIYQWSEINDATDNDPTSVTGLADLL